LALNNYDSLTHALDYVRYTFIIKFHDIVFRNLHGCVSNFKIQE